MKLAIENLGFLYHGTNRRIFRDVTFTLESGDMLSILGANGAGKSTLLNTLAGLFTPTEGCVRVENRSLDSLSAKTRAQYIAYVPQSHAPVYDYSVLDFVVMGRTPYLQAFTTPSGADYEKAEKALERVGAGYLADKIYTRISGGERQLAMIARAVAQEPGFIFFDEPTNHLDFGNQLKIVSLIRSLADEGYGVIMTTHNPDHVLSCGKKVALLDRSGMLNFGSAEEMLTEERLSDLYGASIRVFFSEEMGRTVCLAGQSPFGSQRG